MQIFNQTTETINILFVFINTIEFFIILTLFIISIHILLHFLRDRRLIKILNQIIEPEHIKIDDLKSLPLVNIIIPAWNEGEFFKNCLSSITNLIYPKIKVIIKLK